MSVCDPEALNYGNKQLVESLLASQVQDHLQEIGQEVCSVVVSRHVFLWSCMVCIDPLHIDWSPAAQPMKACVSTSRSLLGAPYLIHTSFQGLM